MPENNVTFIRTNGLGRRDPSLDHISGLLFYSDTLPSGFATNDRVKPVFSLQEAEDLGIVDTHADETKATGGQVQITVPGAADNVNKITIDGVTLGSYTVVSGDDVADVASGLVDAINLLTLSHGFSATLSTDTVVLTAPAKMGIVLNTATVAFSSTGTGAGTITQFSAGVGSFFAVMHYHISEFFRKKPDGKLWIGIYADDTFDASEISDMRIATNGEMRQIGVFVGDEAFATSQLDNIQTELETARNDKENLFGLFHADFSSLTLSNLSNLQSLSDSKVSTVLGEDGNFHQLAYSNTKAYKSGDKVKWLNKTYIAIKSGTGQATYDTDYFSEVSINLPDITGYSISTLGCLLGSYAFGSVNESPANPERFPLTDGNILSEAAFATGDLYKNISKGLRNQINDYHYNYVRTFSGVTGVFFNDSYTSIARSDDYATGENNRTMDKAERNVYTALVPKLVGDITLNEDGTLAQSTINEYHAIVDGQLELMKINGEISEKQVTIDQTQDILQTSELQITMKIIPKGKARNIIVNNSYAVKLN